MNAWFAVRSLGIVWHCRALVDSQRERHACLVEGVTAHDDLQLQVARPVGNGATVEVLDAAGRTVLLSTALNTTTATIDLRAVPAGTYVLRLRTTDAVATRSFVKQ